jgi:uncharacterized lipoprotein YajG
MTMTKNFLAAALLLCALPAAAQEPVSMVYDAKTTDNPPAPVPGACALTVTGVEDQRNNKETVGSEFRPLMSKDPVPWVGAALSGLNAWGYTVTRADNPAPGAAAISATLTRAYIFHGPMRLNGVVAMDARITTPSGKQIDKKYRAFGSKTNMWGAVSEYMDTLNYAMNAVLAQMAADLKDVCAGK